MLSVELCDNLKQLFVRVNVYCVYGGGISDEEERVSNGSTTNFS